MAARASSAVRGDAVLLFLIPDQVWGGRHNLAVAKAEVKTEVAANSEELKLEPDAGAREDRKAPEAKRR